jgi:fumarylacetoacetate (FAA) hydrolase
MKLVTFVRNGSAAERVGVVRGDGSLLDLAVSDPAFAGLSMVDLVREAETLKPLAARLLAEESHHAGAVVPAAGATLLAPIPRPLSLRDGYAFRQHVETARLNRGLAMIPEYDLFPVFYFTNHLAVIGPGELRVGRSRLAKLDYELECFAVIGREITNPTLDEADDAIFGYGVMNDFSARALQMEEMKLNLGPAKGKDFATALGPWLVTKDELAPQIVSSPKGNVLSARMTARVNGVLLSEGDVARMDWTFAEIVQRAADGVTLRPGEVIGSGTVGTGCLLELNGSKVTKDQWLEPGDEVVLAIEGLGSLAHRIVGDPAK